MVLPEDLLLHYGAESQFYSCDQIIFQEGKSANYYYQIKTGTVKLANFFEDRKEFIHGFPYEGLCFGESYLFTNHTYAMSAVAVKSSEILQLPREAFLQLLLEHPELALRVNQFTAERLHFRYIIASFLGISDPEIKITQLFNHLKAHFKAEGQHSFLIPYTRQQIADLIGLRVETVIRFIKKMETENKLLIDHTKIWY